MSLVALSCVIFGAMHFYFRGENKKRERGQRDDKIAGMDEDEILAMGDENPRFRFAT